MSLKAKNSPLLVAFLVLQLGVYLWVTQLVGKDELTKAATDGNWAVTTFYGAIASLAALVTAAFLSEPMKASLVFWRLDDPLPGCRAFTEHASADASRIDTATLERKHGKLPLDPYSQNKLWYRIYLQHGGNVAIKQSHGRYLLLREATVISLLTLVAVALSVPFIPSTLPAWYVLGLAVQYVVLARAAANAGVRFVINVLALESQS